MTVLPIANLLLAVALTACAGEPPSPPVEVGSPAIAAEIGDRQVAVFAGGCFWCMEKPFEKVEGVVSVVSGYAGGAVDNPSYKQVGAGATGHAEVIQVVFDGEVVSYERLLEVYWHNIDPFSANGQFCDRGSQYRAALFPVDEPQRTLALASVVAQQAALGRDVAVTVEGPATFWEAEGYHQDFYKTNPTRYESYRLGCGRDARLVEVWGDAAGH